MNRTTLAYTLISAVGLLGSAALLVAGPLTPPSGPVAGTYKTLSEVEPRIAISSLPPSTPLTINSPGSYYLTNNLLASNGLSAIVLNAPNITIDLNGFTIDGGGVGFRGITAANGSLANITIKNGTITNFTKEAIDLVGCPNVTVDRVTCRIASVAGFGIITGRTATITNATVDAYDAGIIVGEGSLVADCVVNAPRLSHGVTTGTGSTLRNVTVRNGTGAGFNLGNDNNVFGCTATNNDGAGFIINTGTRLDNCAASSNRGSGISLAAGAISWTIERSNISGNVPGGITLATNAGVGTIRGNSIRYNTIGVQIPGTATDVIITQNTFGYGSRSIQLDGNFCQVTANTFAPTQPVTNNVLTAAGTTPPSGNFIAPILTPAQAATATNPFANIGQ